MEEEFYPESVEEWHAWLEEYHSTKESVWIIFDKKSSGLQSFTYEEAVEEALCFGWIDTRVRSIDRRSYKQRFTPRRRNSRWSESNIKRIEKLIREKRMKPAGLEAWNELLKKPGLAYSSAPKEALPVPEILQEKLIQNKQAMEFFVSLSVASKNTYIRWLIDGKKIETRLRRAEKIAERCAAGRKPGMI